MALPPSKTARSLSSSGDTDRQRHFAVRMFAVRSSVRRKPWCPRAHDRCQADDDDAIASVARRETPAPGVIDGMASNWHLDRRDVEPSMR